MWYGRKRAKARFLMEEDIARSSNGRTTDSESVYLGSNPSLAAKARDQSECFGLFANLLARLGFENRSRYTRRTE